MISVAICEATSDVVMYTESFAESVGLPVHVLLTKADKLKRGQAAKALLEVRRELGSAATVQNFSALSRDGEGEAREMLETFLQGPAPQ